jgi:hypothetical protein
MTTDRPARTPRLALSQQEAAEALGVSPDFLQQDLLHEIRCVRRGRRRLYPIVELQRWLDEQATRALERDCQFRTARRTEVGRVWVSSSQKQTCEAVRE